MKESSFDQLAQRISAGRLSRRQTLQAGGAGLAAVAMSGARSTSLAQDAAPVGQPVITGTMVPELAEFDSAMATIFSTWQVPGGQLAVAKDGRLVLNHGYGFADIEEQLPVQPDSLFRIASVSKAITATAVLTLVDAGMLALDEKAFPLIAFQAPDNATPDPRLDTITVQDLLVHAGGWDLTQGFDPQGLPLSRTAAAMVGAADPAEAATIVRFMLGEPLDFDPGTRQAYSNFGFNVLGRVIEHVSGQPYGDYVRDAVLTPSGASAMRLARSRLADRAPGEVHYYSPSNLPRTWSVFWGEGYAPFAYGGNIYLEALDAHGGWIASAADLVRIATAVDGQRSPALLKPETFQAMISTPRPPTGVLSPGTDISAEVTAGLGWDVTESPGFWRAGALMGSTAAWVARQPDGVGLAFTFNSLPTDYLQFLDDVINAVRQTADGVTDWPEGDLFSPDEPA
jgi:N-acyl-D-amino-acid deacylase